MLSATKLLAVWIIILFNKKFRVYAVDEIKHEVDHINGYSLFDYDQISRIGEQTQDESR